MICAEAANARWSVLMTRRDIAVLLALLAFGVLLSFAVWVYDIVEG